MVRSKQANIYVNIFNGSIFLYAQPKVVRNVSTLNQDIHIVTKRIQRRK
jgi:hypothetical protein